MNEQKLTKRENINGMTGRAICLPSSTNASVLELKKLSRQVKLELKRHPSPEKTIRLKETFDWINLVLQRTRQLESDHLRISSSETNKGRKRYQYKLIQENYNTVNLNELVVPRKDFKDSRIKRGVTIRVGDIWKNKFLPDFNYKVLSISEYWRTTELSDKLSFQEDAENTYLIAVEITGSGVGYSYKKIISLPVYYFAEQLYLHDVSFFDTDYTPNYCENCDTYHDDWANDGAVREKDI